MSQENQRPLRAGEMIGCYQVKEVLGSGGFGITYLAEDTNLHIQVAIKEYFPVFAHRESVSRVVRVNGGEMAADYASGLRRFLEEARKLAKFKHFNIIRVLYVVEANDTAYMVMEYEEGETLERRVKRAGVISNPRELWAIFLSVLDGLKVVHREGLLHLDIKPDNIFLRKTGMPCLIDFGGAKHLAAQAFGATARRSALTSMVFSEGYSPLEQYSLEDSSELGVWTDIYALGMTLYFAVSGLNPVAAPTRMSQRKRDPIKLQLEKLEGKYGSGLLRVIERSVALEREERFESALEMQDALDVVLRGDEAQVGNRKVRIEVDKVETKPLDNPKKINHYSVKILFLTLIIAFMVGLFVLDEFYKEKTDKQVASTQQPLATSPTPIVVAPPAQLNPPIVVVPPAPVVARLSYEPEMVKIPAGSFMMGSENGGNDEKPVHRVNIKEFWMGKYEVTVGQFRAFVEDSGYRTDAEKEDGCYGWTGSNWEKRKEFSWRKVGISQGENHPVVCVSWNDAIAYTQWLSTKTGKEYRLPTESEWEYAARGNTETTYWWGDDIGVNNANCGNKICKDTYRFTAPVGSFRENPFYLYDVSGNVWEWTCSEYDSYTTGKHINCSKLSNYIVARGGSCFNVANYLRISYRFGVNIADFDNSNIGFRLVSLP